ncbi:glycosyltransferase [Pseudogemmobacter bohemicus]|uniref:glycosyltransferase n=1 Tax=Pseudogemmobacter bohemicus TaxID=2250708 RepID=UPI000DD2C7AD|nr:glycosyltransferase [Pseudogemmobacter bohemicus]
MGGSRIHDPGAAQAQESAGPDRFALSLLRHGLIRPEQPGSAAARQPAPGGSGFLPHGTLAEDDLLAAAGDHFGAPFVDPVSPPPEAAAIDRLGTGFCQRHGILPLRRAGAVTVVATSRPETFATLRPVIEAQIGPVLMALAPAARIAQALALVRGPQIAHAAETRVATDLSCRTWGGIGLKLTVAAIFAALMGLVANFPVTIGLVLLVMVLGAMVLSTLMKLVCGIATLRRPAPPQPDPVAGPLPRVSVLVALYRESDIAPRLVRRLSRLDYPRDLLEVVLAVEEEDHLTRNALEGAGLPAWMRIVVVPPGRVKTKPRALNVALDHCHGAIIGVYDAEDAPDPDQIRRVVTHFRQSDSGLACVQGVLDYYNPATNWIARMFTIEYAAWFRLILPGVARLGLMVPLGGTTLFFRRDVLDDIGAWDSHNVTEDADLGIRLARAGYRTELLSTVTREEANCRPVPWVKQRSRWIKGHMMTWIVHMRQPLRLWREVGTRAFLGFQVMFLGAAVQTLLAPLLWSFWIIAFGFSHPLAEALPEGVAWAMLAAFLLSAVVDFTLGWLALKQAGHRISKFWVFTLHLYQPLATFAGAKALWELITRPFYWDKTSHGIFDNIEAAGTGRKKPAKG